MRHFCGAARGFTLLELLIVLALVGLLAGIAAPRLWAWVEGAQTRSVLAEARGRLEGLPTAAFFGGRPLVVAGAADAGIELPTGWRLELPQPLQYEANGMTRGGRVLLWQGDALTAEWQVTAPAGRVERAGR